GVGGLRGGGGAGRDSVFVVHRHTVAERLPADGAIHRAAVDVPVAERGRNRASDGALPGARWTVDGNDQRFHGTDGPVGLVGRVPTRPYPAHGPIGPTSLPRVTCAHARSPSCLAAVRDRGGDRR